MNHDYSYIITGSAVTVIRYSDGKTIRVTSDNVDDYQQALDLIKKEKFEEVFNLSLRERLEEFVSTSSNNASDDDIEVWLDADCIKYRVTESGEEKVLHNSLTDRTIQLMRDGFNIKPMLNFIKNVLRNPSKTAVDELYLFLEASELPITEDGRFVAYKIVQHDYTSIYDNKTLNAVGTYVSMPRNEVDDNRDTTCSTGLHFCSKGYLKHYGSNFDTDRLLLLLIDPADVVSIPKDYNNAKGRATRYYIWKDITEPDWRNKYGVLDYTDLSVEVVNGDDDEYYYEEEENENEDEDNYDDLD